MTVQPKQRFLLKTRVITDESIAVWELADELAAALSCLYDEQNGPPLLGPNHEPYYEAAIARTEAALARYRKLKDEYAA